MKIVVVIPAHNEEVGILDTLASVAAQSLQPDRVVVLCDNCTDNTATLAEAAGYEVWHTETNAGKKGGALNQAWEKLDLQDGDYFATMDADTILHPDFLANAMECYARKGLMYGEKVGGVCATFTIKPLGTAISLAQELEYARFCRAVGRQKGKPKCLAGAAVVYKADALREVHASRGYLYAPVLVEDYELTLAIRHNGWKTYAPKKCRAVTEIMPTLKTLWHQRMRWYMGTMQELRKCGVSKITLPDWKAQMFTVFTITMRWLFVFTLVTSFFVVGAVHFPKWAPLPLLVFSFVRAVEAHRLGWRYSILAALMFEELYLLLLETIFLASGLKMLFGSNDHAWVHVPAQQQVTAEVPALEAA